MKLTKTIPTQATPIKRNKSFRHSHAATLDFSATVKVLPPSYFAGEMVQFKLSPYHYLIQENWGKPVYPEVKKLSEIWMPAIVHSCVRCPISFQPTENITLQVQDQNGHPYFINLKLPHNELSQFGGTIIRATSYKATALRSKLKAQWRERVQEILSGPKFMQDFRNTLQLSLPALAVLEEGSKNNATFHARVPHNKKLPK